MQYQPLWTDDDTMRHFDSGAYGRRRKRTVAFGAGRFTKINAKNSVENLKNAREL
jgi:hypothetical protein